MSTAPDPPVRAGSPSGSRAPGCPDRTLLGGLTPETRLLLAAAPADPDPARLEAPIEEGVRWDRVLALLLRERAVLPFWRSVRPVAHRIDPEARASLERLANVTEFRMKRLRTRLAESLDALEDAGIGAVVLKGGALAHTLYPDWRDRPMSDLDLLVEPGRAEDARRALLDRGWSRDDDRYPEEMYRRHYHLPPLEDTAGSGAVLELHTGLLLPGHPFPLDLDAFRRRARPARVAGLRMSVPAPVDHLLYLCLHFAWSHSLESGAWRTCRDVRVLSGADDFAWSDFVERAGDARAGPFAYWTVRLACSLGSVPVPGEVSDALRPPLPSPVLRGLERHLSAQLFATEPGCPSVLLAHGLWLVATRPSGGRPDGIRPWAFSGDFRGRPTAERGGEAGRSDPGLWTRLRRHLSRPAPWRSYLSRVLTG